MSADPWSIAPTLAGRFIALRPTTMADADGLAAAFDDLDALQYFLSGVESQAPSADTVRHALASGRQVLTQFDPATGRIVGTTSLYNMSEEHGRVTVGFTWLSASVRGGAVNSESKLLLLQHVFQTLGAARAEFNVDDQNLRSRAAVLAIGATEEGVLRSHARRRDGSRRNTVVYSVLAAEWPAVRDGLKQRIRARG